MEKKKQGIIAFKVDRALAEVLGSLPNRSEFIRAAVLHALENTCPLCQGSGLLSPEQKRHWEAFLATHSLHTCEECRAVHLVCGEDFESCRH